LESEEAVSYARASGDSDVYVIADADDVSLACYGCALAPGRVEIRHFHTTGAMLAHLAEHAAAGHRVPERCLARLRAEADANDAWMRERERATDGES
jgi:hypothetical protein